MKGAAPLRSDAAPAIVVLRNAHALIAKEGWCQGKLFTNGRYCLEGAIRVCGDRDKIAMQTAMALMRSAIGLPTGPVRALFDWNDVRGRTKREVLDALEAGIDEAEWYGRTGRAP